MVNTNLDQKILLKVAVNEHLSICPCVKKWKKYQFDCTIYFRNILLPMHIQAEV